MSQTPVADKIRNKLQAAFAPEMLDLTDESGLHRGHAGHNPQGESHFRLTMTSAFFNGKTRLERQRMVYAALAEEMAGRVHALAMKLQGTEDT